MLELRVPGIVGSVLAGREKVKMSSSSVVLVFEARLVGDLMSTGLLSSFGTAGVASVEREAFWFVRRASRAVVTAVGSDQPDSVLEMASGNS